jgi:hypothetical protein
MKHDVKNVKRACSAQFVMDEGYENESLRIEGNKVLFPRNGFYITYTGGLLNIIDNYHHSPGGHRIHFAHPDRRPFAVKFEKGRLLQDLLDDCEKQGAEIRFDTIAAGWGRQGRPCQAGCQKTGKFRLYKGKEVGDCRRRQCKNSRHIRF